MAWRLDTDGTPDRTTGLGKNRPVSGLRWPQIAVGFTEADHRKCTGHSLVNEHVCRSVYPELNRTRPHETFCAGTETVAVTVVVVCVIVTLAPVPSPTMLICRRPSA